MLWWGHRRAQRRWAVQQQVRELEQSILEESLPEDQRAWRQQGRQQQAEIHREARRRPGLPEEADDD